MRQFNVFGGGRSIWSREHRTNGSGKGLGGSGHHCGWPTASSPPEPGGGCLESFLRLIGAAPAK
ncbi:MAG: hypothetical protein MZV64_23160 [Ignavibacteriales bacterium]|nr:hypothetical protein [Ignavibacteriales bacterium]